MGVSAVGWWRTAGCLLLAGLLLAGCSFFAVPSARTTPSGQVACPATYAPPLIDSLFAAAGASLIIFGGIEEKNEEGGDAPDQNFAALPGILILVPFAISALYGFVKVGNCKAAARGRPS